MSTDTTIFIKEAEYIKVEWKTGYLAHSKTRCTDRGKMAPGLHATHADALTQI